MQLRRGGGAFARLRENALMRASVVTSAMSRAVRSSIVVLICRFERFYVKTMCVDHVRSDLTRSKVGGTGARGFARASLSDGRNLCS